VLEITNCIKQKYLKSSQPLSSVNPLYIVFEKAIFQYAIQNNKTLIAMLNHNNAVHIFTTKAIFRKINLTEGEKS